MLFFHILIFSCFLSNSILKGSDNKVIINPTSHNQQFVEILDPEKPKEQRRRFWALYYKEYGETCVSLNSIESTYSKDSPYNHTAHILGWLCERECFKRLADDQNSEYASHYAKKHQDRLEFARLAIELGANVNETQYPKPWNSHARNFYQRALENENKELAALIKAHEHDKPKKWL